MHGLVAELAHIFVGHRRAAMWTTCSARAVVLVSMFRFHCRKQSLRAEVFRQHPLCISVPSLIEHIACVHSARFTKSLSHFIP